MRTVATTLAITLLLLGVCVWWTTKDSIRPEPTRDRVGRDVPAVVAPEYGSTLATTRSAPPTVPPDKPATPTTVPRRRPAATYVLPIGVPKWLVGQLVDEGLSKPDAERIVRATEDKLAKCQKLYGRYGRFPGRTELTVCAQNAIQESGMSEAFRRLAAKIKAANAAYQPPPDQAPHPPSPDTGSGR